LMIEPTQTKAMPAEPVNTASVIEPVDTASATTDAPGTWQAEELIVPLHREALDVSRQQVETGRVQVSTITKATDALVDELLTHERVEIERVAVGRVVEKTPPIREEGETTIIPVVEETLVVEKRLVLKEEIHIRRVRVTEQHRETVVLREQEVVIRRSNTGVTPSE
jgi:uncharacterized protein (TIGR02271 family)